MAPGLDGVNFAQQLWIDAMESIANPQQYQTKNYVSPSVRQDYETQLLPSGMLWQFTLHSTWGDPFYIGLDGLDFFDATGDKISLDPQQVIAFMIDSPQTVCQVIDIADFCTSAFPARYQCRGFACAFQSC